MGNASRSRDALEQRVSAANASVAALQNKQAALERRFARQAAAGVSPNLTRGRTASESDEAGRVSPNPDAEVSALGGAPPIPLTALSSPPTHSPRPPPMHSLPPSPSHSQPPPPPLANSQMSVGGATLLMAPLLRPQPTVFGALDEAPLDVRLQAPPPTAPPAVKFAQDGAVRERGASSSSVLDPAARPPPVVVGGSALTSAEEFAAARAVTAAAQTTLADLRSLRQPNPHPSLSGSASLPSLSAAVSWQPVPRQAPPPAAAVPSTPSFRDTSSFRGASPGGKSRRSRRSRDGGSFRGGAPKKAALTTAADDAAGAVHSSRRAQLLAWRDTMRDAESEARATRAEWRQQEERERMAAALQKQQEEVAIAKARAKAEAPATPADASGHADAGAAGAPSAAPAPADTIFTQHKTLLERSLSTVSPAALQALERADRAAAKAPRPHTLGGKKTGAKHFGAEPPQEDGVPRPPPTC